MNKQKLRIYYKSLLKKKKVYLNSEDFLSKIKIPNNINIGVYQPTKFEVIPFELYKILHSEYNCKLSYPKIEENKIMNYYFNGEKNIPSYLIIPCLVAYKNYRLGYGGGYFDRYLLQHKNIYTIGITQFETDVNFVDVWDMELNEIYFVK